MDIKIKTLNGITHVRVLTKHPSETGKRLNSDTGKPIPAHYIQQLSCEHAGMPVMVAQFGLLMPENPYLAFSFKGGVKGDSLIIRWNDNTGDSQSIESIL